MLNWSKARKRNFYVTINHVFIPFKLFQNLKSSAKQGAKLIDNLILYEMNNRILLIWATFNELFKKVYITSSWIFHYYESSHWLCSFAINFGLIRYIARWSVKAHYSDLINSNNV